MMKKDKLTPRTNSRNTPRSHSPQNVVSKTRSKECFIIQKQAGKDNQPITSKDQNSMKICLDLASYHKKEAEELKHRNEVLQSQLKEEVEGIEGLRNELKKIKISLQGTQSSKKGTEQLKNENDNLKNELLANKNKIIFLNERIEQLSLENTGLKSKARQTLSILIDLDSKCQNPDINTLTLAKQSRRQQIVNRYQSLSFVPSLACLECGRKDNELEHARDKYSNELRLLQDQLNTFQRSQVTIEIMERQLISKNECIDYLVQQLGSLELDSQAILQNMTFLERKLKEFESDSLGVRGRGSDLLHNSFSKPIT